MLSKIAYDLGFVSLCGLASGSFYLAMKDVYHDVFTGKKRITKVDVNSIINNGFYIGVFMSSTYLLLKSKK